MCPQNTNDGIKRRINLLARLQIFMARKTFITAYCHACVKAALHTSRVTTYYTRKREEAQEGRAFSQREEDKNTAASWSAPPPALAG